MKKKQVKNLVYSSHKKKEIDAFLSTNIFLESLFRNISDGIVLVDKRDLSIVFYNSGMERIHGKEFKRVRNLSDWLGQYFPDEAYRQKIFNLWKRDTASQNPPERIFKLTFLDGTIGWVRYRVSFFNDYIIVVAQDVTEQEKIKESLAESERQYRKTIDSMRDAIHVVDSSLRIILVNKPFVRWCRKLGLSTELLGKSIMKAFPFLPSQVKNEYRQVFKSGRMLVTEANAFVSGKEILTETRKIPIKEGNRIEHVVTVVRDVTDERKNREALREVQRKLEDKVAERTSELIKLNRELRGEIKTKNLMQKRLQEAKEWTELLFKFTPIALLTVDNQRRITSWNDKASEITGYQAKETIGKKCLFFAQAPCTKKCGLFSDAVKKPVIGHECVIRTKKGEVKVVLKNVDLLRDAKGKVVGGIESFQDISGLKKIQNELIVSQEKYASLYETSRDAIMIIEPPSWRFTAGNASTIEMFKAKDEKDFTRRSPWDFSPKKQPDGEDSHIKAQKMIEQALKDGSNFFEWTHKRVTGEEFPATVLLAKMTLEGKDVLQATVRDITAQKKMQDKLIQSEKLSAVGQLSSGVAHEFNNILAVIKGNIQLAKKGIIPPEKFEKIFSIVETQADRGAHIATNMLAFSLPQSLKMEVCTIHEVIDEALSLQGKAFEFERIALKLNYTAKTKVEIDRIQMQQVFLNLMLNARHAILPKKKGVISISTKDSGNMVEISFSDNGIGISEGKRKHIFNPFFTTKGAMAKDKYNIKGTGLGLSVTHTILQSHNGSISVESKEGKGSTFILTLPCAKKSADKKKPVKKLSRKLKPVKKQNLRILFVDDEKEITGFLQRALEQDGYKEIAIANTGKQAMKLFKARKFDIVFLDLLLPDTQGETVFNEMKRLRSAVPVVFISGKLGLNEAELKKKGVYAFLAKPFNIEEVQKLVSKVAGKNNKKDTRK